jgi:PHD/YefM family antitoxin component YafN of YafNO toxin-antitoxin module
MSDVCTLKLGRKEYVIIPRKRYEQLTRAEQDPRDAEIARKGRAAFEAGKMKTISHAELKRRLGL